MLLHHKANEMQSEQMFRMCLESELGFELSYHTFPGLF